MRMACAVAAALEGGQAERGAGEDRCCCIWQQERDTRVPGVCAVAARLHWRICESGQGGRPINR
jgi:hypothetical protein